jgi:Ca-activated chloride channel family protein
VKPIRIVWLLPFLFGFELFQSPNKSVEAGNTQLKGGKPEQALADYDKAVAALPAEPGVHFDRGAALYALSRHDEAVQEFLRATEAKTTPLKAAAFYNLGNSFFKTEKYADAIAAYRRSLALDPNDIRAKWNLELALKKKKDEDQKKKDQQSQDDKNKDKDKQDKDKQAKNDDKSDDKSGDKKDDKSADKNEPDKQDKDKQDQAQNEQKKADEKKQEQAEQKAQEKQDAQKQEQAKNEAQKGDGQKPEKAADMREIEAVLDGLERSPKSLEQERARLRAVRRQPPSKDW